MRKIALKSHLSGHARKGHLEIEETTGAGQCELLQKFCAFCHWMVGSNFFLVVRFTPPSPNIKKIFFVLRIRTIAAGLDSFGIEDRGARCVNNINFLSALEGAKRLLLLLARQ